jgi:hypothetical protein
MREWEIDFDESCRREILDIRDEFGQGGFSLGDIDSGNKICLFSKIDAYCLDTADRTRGCFYNGGRCLYLDYLEAHI